MRLIVTRPEREAQRWVRDLTVLGLDARALPLIKVGPVDDPAELGRAWQHLADYVGVMFVSGNAVQYFFAVKPPSEQTGALFDAIKTRAWAPGPGTARALLREGLAPAQLDVPAADAGQFDSEALWSVVGAQVRAGDRVLVVRGGDSSPGTSAGQGLGREWFANRVRHEGGEVDFVLAYQRGAPSFSPQERELALQAANDGSVWLFSSTESVLNLGDWLPDVRWTNAVAVATHPRIAAAAKALGFASVLESRPTLPDVVATLKLVATAAG
jgi:uroporphyrinogen-III synthase